MPDKPGVIVIEGHVQGLSNTRALGEAGIPVYVVDKTNCLARYSKYSRKFFKCPDFLKVEFVNYLIELAKTESLKDWALMPSNDHAVYTISKYKAKLEEYYKIITPGIEIIERIYDKSKLLDIAKGKNIPIPETQYLKTALGQLDGLAFPVLTKGRFGLSFYKATGRKVFFAKSQSELQRQLEEIERKISLEKTISQELIPSDGSNRTISFTAFCIDGLIKTFWMGEKVREHPIQFGTATFARSVFIQGCLDQSIPLLEALKYTGVCEAEYLKDPRDNKYKLIEINARTWLWVGLAKSCGVDYAVMIYNHLNNIPNLYPEKYEIGVNWVNYITDIVFSLQSLFKGRLKLKQYFCVFKGKTVNAIFSWKDLLPGIMFFFLLLYIALKRKQS